MPEKNPRNRSRQRAARALARTTGQSYQAVVTRQPALPKPGTVLALDDYQAVGLARFGTADQNRWSWTCPHCLWITTPTVYQEAGADPVVAAYECLVLHRNPSVVGARQRGDFHRHTSRPCTATAEELPVEQCYTLVADDGTQTRVFPFTEPDATLESNRELWLARVYAEDERREADRLAELERRRAQAKAEDAMECLGCEEPEGLPHTNDCPFRATELGAAETVGTGHVTSDPDAELERWQGLDTWLLRYADAVRTALRGLGLTVHNSLFDYVAPDVGESAYIDISVTTPDGGSATFTWFDYAGWCQERGADGRSRNRGEQDGDGYVPRAAEVAEEIAAVVKGTLTWTGVDHIYREPTNPEVFRPLLERLAEAVEEAEALQLPLN
ncbi:hypothetical protein ACWDG9_16460 [Streptomyces sp. NPDC001073]